MSEAAGRIEDENRDQKTRRSIRTSPCSKRNRRLSQLVFQDLKTSQFSKIIISWPRNALPWQRSPAAQGKDVFWECVPCPLPGINDSLARTIHRHIVVVVVVVVVVEFIILLGNSQQALPFYWEP